MSIPVVDISPVNLHQNVDDLRPDDVKSVAYAVKKALLDWGFVYLSGHGIPGDKVKNVFESSEKFFNLPLNIKRKYQRGNVSLKESFGYVGIGAETLDKNNYEDVKEAFDFCIDGVTKGIKPWPDEVPDFKTSMEQLHHVSGELAKRILFLFGIGLELDDPWYFMKAHSRIGGCGNGTSLRTLYYPPLKETSGTLPGQLRCSEHTDYGSMTLLFQDPIGGLLVKRRDGSFVPAAPVKDAVLLNIADLLQRWTNDELMSVRHKVVIPEEEVRMRIPRQSIAFFIHPNSDVTVECIKGTNKYSPVNADDYLWARFKDTLDTN